MKKSISYIVFALLMGLSQIHAQAEQHPVRNGFVLSNLRIPLEEIKGGGPPKDGIPSIDKPIFEKAAEATWLKAEDNVLGLVVNGIARAYPIRIMNWHEVVNDVIGDQPIVITFCPLCGSGIAFDAKIDGQAHSFGVSGLLYNSDVLLYDREDRKSLVTDHERKRCWK